MTRRLLYLNGIAIICAVLFHTAGWGLTAMFAWTPQYLSVSEPVFDQTGSLPYYWIRFVEQVIAIAIPSFLFVSGYFIAIATGRRDNLPFSQIWGRIKALLIPYTFWTLLIWSSGFLLLGDKFSANHYVISFLTGSTSITFYYVPLLIQYYILSPLIIRFARHQWVPLLIVTGIFQLYYQLGYILEMMYGYENIPKVIGWVAFIPKWLFLSRLFWFTLGVVVCFHITQFKEFFGRFKWVFIVTAIACIPLGMVEWEAIFRFSGQNWLNMRETILDSIYTLAFIFALLTSTNSALPLNSQISDLGMKSFGIYLTHYIGMEYTAKLIYHFVPWLLGIQVLFQPIIMLVGFAFPLLLMFVVENTTLRRYYRYIFG